MIIDQNMVNLICNLEYYIGSECYNPNSYDGWNRTWGRSYRYPVHFICNEKDPTEASTKYWATHYNINPDQIKTMKYKFGSNHLFVGQGLARVLGVLEQRYGLDFNKLEEEYQSKDDEETENAE